MSNSAEGAEYDSQGQARSASPLELMQNVRWSPGKGATYGAYFGLSGLGDLFVCLTRGDVPTKSGLAPGFHIARLWRCHEQRVTKRDFFPAAGHDLFLPVYDPFVSLMGFDRARRELVSAANIEPGHHILDIGCGTGTLVVMLKRQYPVAQMVGLDPDPKALRRARIKASRAAVSVQFDQGFADQLPYKEDSFDRVFSSFMFHHLEEQERENMLREVLRVLKVGGSFHLLDFVADHASHGFLDRLFQSHARIKDNRDATILELMGRVGLTNAAKVKEGSMLFGLLRTAYYHASAPHHTGLTK